MRTSALFVVLLLSMSGLASAQDDWTDYVNVPDGFHVDFPGQPKITNITWDSWHQFKYPGHVYSVDKGNEHYSMTVVDYATAEQQGLEKAKTCPAGAEPCLGGDLSGIGYWKHDIRGAIQNAVFRIFTRPNTQIKDFSWTMEDLVEGDQLELLNTATGARTFGFVTMHKNKLYILEATVPKGYPPPALFTISLGWVDPQGKPVRYRTMYNNEFMEIEKVPTPGLAGGGGAAGAGAAGGGGRGGRGGAGRQGGGAGRQGGGNGAAADPNQ
jgi:hypothetical protein